MTEMFGMNAWILLVLVTIAPVILYLIWTSLTHCCAKPPSEAHQRLPSDDGRADDDHSVSTAAGSRRREVESAGETRSGSLGRALGASSSSRPFPGSGTFTSSDMESGKMEENPIKDTRFVGNKRAPSSSAFFSGMFQSS